MAAVFVGGEAVGGPALVHALVGSRGRQRAEVGHGAGVAGGGVGDCQRERPRLLAVASGGFDRVSSRVERQPYARVALRQSAVGFSLVYGYVRAQNAMPRTQNHVRGDFLRRLCGGGSDEVDCHVRPRAQRERVEPRVSVLARRRTRGFHGPRRGPGFTAGYAASPVERSETDSARIRIVRIQRNGRRRRVIGDGRKRILHANHVLPLRKRAQQTRGDARFQPSVAGVVYGDAMRLEKRFGVRNIACGIDGYVDGGRAVGRRRIGCGVGDGGRRNRIFARRGGDGVERRD